MVQQLHTSDDKTQVQATLSCYNLSAQQAGRTLYEHVGFSLLESATLVISGDNGCGKTTLLKQLAGLSQQRSGEMLWFNTPIKRAEDYDHDMLYISDQHGLYPEFTVSEQLHYIALQWGHKLLIDPTIHYMQFEPYLNTPVHALSAGWKRRVALSRLMLIPSLLWLLDEPMMHLDAEGLVLLGGLLHSHAEKGGAAIITMPSIEAAPTLYETPVSILKLADFASVS